MNIDIICLFPEIVESVVNAGVLGRARQQKLYSLFVHDLRQYGLGKHKTIDEPPFGGGPGMVLKPEPIFSAVRDIRPNKPLLCLSASGSKFTQAKAEELASSNGFSLLCGRYEGIDQRVIDELVDEEISIGDYVLAGGEVAAGVVLESVLRLVPGVLGNIESSEQDSYCEDLVEHPQYTRPAEFEGLAVPEVLLSGDHALVQRWRKAQSIFKTAKIRPDLLEARGSLTKEEATLMQEFNFDI